MRRVLSCRFLVVQVKRRDIILLACVTIPTTTTQSLFSFFAVTVKFQRRKMFGILSVYR